jgi:hypothetical protein
MAIRFTPPYCGTIHRRCKLALVPILVVLKLVLVPALIVSASLAGRRWGPPMAGLVASFPLVAGPALLFLAIERRAVAVRSRRPMSRPSSAEDRASAAVQRRRHALSRGT